MTTTFAQNTDAPLAGKVLLVEDGAVGAEERILDRFLIGNCRAYVEHLATSFNIGVVT
jgi:hypothetical protein